MENYTRILRLQLLVWLIMLLFGQVTTAQNPAWRFRHTLDSILDQQPSGIHTPGYALCIVENGQIVYERQAGMANIAQKIPVNETTRFNIGSLSKQFTAMCILLLEEEGHLRQTDDIHLYIPELPDYGYPITIGHLTGHTSGIRDYLELLNMQRKMSNRQLLNRSMLNFQQKWRSLNFAPGEDFDYSNTGYMMLCTIVERVSGMTLAEFAQQRIFGPLGMTNTYFQQEGQKGVAGKTTSYSIKSGGKKFKKDKEYVDALGATGVHTTMRDMAKWDQNFYKNILGKGTQQLITQMETGGALNSGAPTHYGAGLFLRHSRGFPEVEHTGGWGSFTAQYRRFPQQKTSVITASNAESPGAFAINDIVCRLILPAPEKLPSHSPQPFVFLPEQFTGIYLSDNNWVRKVQYVDSSLFIILGNSGNAGKRRLIYISSDGNNTQFQDTLGNTVAFRNTGGKIQAFNWAGGHYFPSERVYRRIDNNNPPHPEKYTGRYYSKDFKRHVRIKYKHKQLIMRPFPFVKFRLKPVTDTVFEVMGEAQIIRFAGDSFEVGDMWNRGIRLERKSPK